MTSGHSLNPFRISCPKVGPVEREFDTEIVEQRPDERIAWRSVDGKSHAGVVTFSPPDALQVKADMRKFKDFIESRGTETGGWRGEVEDSGPTGQL